MHEELIEEKEFFLRENSRYNDCQPAALDQQCYSLALSGGGIRSASVARGLLNRLQEIGLTNQIKYLSVVSGGAYAGAEFLFEQDAEKRRSHSLGVNYSRGDALRSLLIDFTKRSILFAIIPFMLWVIFRSTGLSIINTNPDVSKIAMLGIGLIILLTAAFSTIYSYFGIAHGRLSRAIAILIVFTTSFLYSIYLAQIWPLLPVIAIATISIAISLIFQSTPHRASDNSWLIILSKIITTAATFLIIIEGLEYWSLHLSTDQIRSKLITFLTIYLIAIAYVKFKRNNFQSLYNYYKKNITQAFIPNHNGRRLEELRTTQPSLIINITIDDGSEEFQSELIYSHLRNKNGSYQKLKDGISIADAVSASGSAIDAGRLKWGGGLPAILLPGTSYWRNPFKADNKLNITEQARIAFSAPSEETLRISDGGFTDNLGIISLFRRKELNIICLDSSYDPDYSFSDLKYALKQAVATGLIDTIDIKYLLEFSEDLKISAKHGRILELLFAYPQEASNPAKTGKLILIKLNSTKSKLRAKYIDFPHITTNDQLLKDDELIELQSIGTDLANELHTHITMHSTAPQNKL